MTADELMKFFLESGVGIVHNFGLAILAYIFCHIAIRIAMALDKKSALARCTRMGTPIISSKQRQESNKANEYFRDLRADALIDVLWMFSAFIIMRSWTSVHIPLFPFFSIYRALKIVLIERKSIKENSSKKYKDASEEATKEIMKFVEENADFRSEILKIIRK